MGHKEVCHATYSFADVFTTAPAAIPMQCAVLCLQHDSPDSCIQLGSKQAFVAVDDCMMTTAAAAPAADEEFALFIPRNITTSEHDEAVGKSRLQRKEQMSEDKLEGAR